MTKASSELRWTLLGTRAEVLKLWGAAPGGAVGPLGGRGRVAWIRDIFF
jgi:hypothetical protein